ncbi:tRNA/rRNA methyltransferase [Parasponia andersonii]|uniref:tRNA/rRNA methyltransferase n=1 Tax=Parasponia andersonii TaxID=3476 RepID=A0A2P5CY57_PARAD|nr:tRNA/rRNA methyltransferase [Parasponia andersonii]
MAASKALLRTSIFSLGSALRSNNRWTSSSISVPISPTLCFSTPLSSTSGCPGLSLVQHRAPSRTYASIEGAPVSIEPAYPNDEPQSETLAQETPEEDNVEHLLTHRDDVVSLMKMERRRIELDHGRKSGGGGWFPYLDRFSCGSYYLSSGEVLEALGPHIMDSRKERFRTVVRNRSYSVCLVVEGLTDYGNVSAAFRSADALGFQSVHVVSCDSSKRYRENRHVSMGAEKWLDIELWDSIQECFKVLKSRGYRITTTHVGMDAVSVYEMDWSCPTAIVVGNENKGISDEALELSDLHCSIPMNGMVDSFNVSVAAGILMHHAVCDRTSRLGYHGDLTMEQSRILVAEFSLRHSKSSISIAHEYAKRKAALLAREL